MDRSLSKVALERAQRSIAGGVNSPVRAFKAVGGLSLLAAGGTGPYLLDLDGNRYVDYLMSWGAIILGHAHPEVRSAIERAVKDGNGYGLSTQIEYELAEIIKEAFPSIELLRLVNSGTEAVMSAVRLARGFTGRDKVLVFEGCYHGHSDGLLARAGSGLATFSIPSSGGVPGSFAAETLIAQYNDLESVEHLAGSFGDDIACVLVEPVGGNMGVVPPEPGFLAGLRSICDRVGALLIFDEVITGFRIAWGGAQEKYGVSADLTTLGKVIGGGLPVGAFGGRRDVMSKLAPLGDVYQAGTLSGNPVVASAGKAVLEFLRRHNPYRQLEEKTLDLTLRISDAARELSLPVSVNQVGSMFTIFFAEKRPRDFESAKRADPTLYSRFFNAMLDRGVLLPPSQWEAAFLSTAHLEGDIGEITMSAAMESLYSLVDTPALGAR